MPQCLFDWFNMVKKIFKRPSGHNGRTHLSTVAPCELMSRCVIMELNNRRLSVVEGVFIQFSHRTRKNNSVLKNYSLCVSAVCYEGVDDWLRPPCSPVMFCKLCCMAACLLCYSSVKYQHLLENRNGLESFILSLLLMPSSCQCTMNSWHRNVADSGLTCLIPTMMSKDELCNFPAQEQFVKLLFACKTCFWSFALLY